MSHSFGKAGQMFFKAFTTNQQHQCHVTLLEKRVLWLDLKGTEEETFGLGSFPGDLVLARV